MKVALYARTSAAKQAEKDSGISEQIRQMQDYCKHHGHNIVAEYRDEGYSGEENYRPEFHGMMKDIQTGQISIEAVLVTTASRFFRDALATLVWRQRLIECGVRVIAIAQETGDPDTPTAQLLDTIFAAIDEHESRMVGCHSGNLGDD